MEERRKTWEREKRGEVKKNDNQLEEMRKNVGERKEGVNRAFKERKKKIVEGKNAGRLTIGSPGHSKSNVTVFGKVKKISLSFTY